VTWLVGHIATVTKRGGSLWTVSWVLY